MSVQPTWAAALTYQQQSVLFLATRGPDGVAKKHPCKAVYAAYRGTVLNAACYGRPLHWGEKADGFMSLDVIADAVKWEEAVKAFFDSADALPHHYLTHFMHGAQIVGFKHPDMRFRERWSAFYLRLVESMHLMPETEEQMDQRLGDWERAQWDAP